MLILLLLLLAAAAAEAILFENGERAALAAYCRLECKEQRIRDRSICC